MVILIIFIVANQLEMDGIITKLLSEIETRYYCKVAYKIKLRINRLLY